VNYLKLIGKVKKEHLCSIEFKGENVIIKKQIGNTTGAVIEIEFKDSKRIENITFVSGGYNEPKTIKQDFNNLIDIILDC